jgi:hypothetical protein
MVIFIALLSCGGDWSYVSDIDGDGYVVPDDCNDLDEKISPASLEYCDGFDNNCNGVTDEQGAEGGHPWYLDLDEDGFHGGPPVLMACIDPGSIYSLDSSDCDDATPEVNPDALEICNGIDDDCDGHADDADSAVSFTEDDIWYHDLDEDGYGDPGDVIENCEGRSLFIKQPGDCDDTDSEINPGVPELCSTPGIDDNCDGSFEEEGAEGALQYFEDSDGDGQGSEEGLWLCEQLDGWSVYGSDCDDADPDVFLNSHLLETEDSIDQDCDGRDLCWDPYCDSWTELLLPLQGGGIGLASIDGVGSLAPASSLGIDKVLYAAVSISMEDGYRRAIFAEESGVCEGQARLWKMEEGGFEPEYVLWDQRFTWSGFSDMDGDGVEEVLLLQGHRPAWLEDESCPISEEKGWIIWLSHTGSTIGIDSAVPLDAGGVELEVADIDGDGHQDILHCAYGPGTLSSISWGPNWQSTDLDVEACSDAAIADVDADGDLDIVVAVAAASASKVFWGDGARFASSAGQELGTSMASRVQIGDYDQDGSIDLLFGAGPLGGDWSQPVGTFWGDGERFASGIGTEVEAHGCLYPETADADSDGDLDLICPNYAETTASGDDFLVDSYVYWASQGWRWEGSEYRRTLHSYGALYAAVLDLDENGSSDMLLGGWGDGASTTRIYWDEPTDNFGSYSELDVGGFVSPPLFMGGD